MNEHTFERSSTGAGIVNTDISAYKSALAKSNRDKYIKGLESRIEKLEDAMSLLQKTLNEMSK